MEGLSHAAGRGRSWIPEAVTGNENAWPFRVPARTAPRGTPSITSRSRASRGLGDNRSGGWYSYRASKAALNLLIRTAAIEVARTHPHAVLAAVHPGTVATRFTAGYPGHDKVTPEVAAANILRVLERLTPQDSGGFFDWSGAPVPW